MWNILMSRLVTVTQCCLLLPRIGVYALIHGIPQGPLLGPLLFLIYLQPYLSQLPLLYPWHNFHYYLPFYPHPTLHACSDIKLDVLQLSQIKICSNTNLQSCWGDTVAILIKCGHILIFWKHCYASHGHQEVSCVWNWTCGWQAWHIINLYPCKD